MPASAMAMAEVRSTAAPAPGASNTSNPAKASPAPSQRAGGTGSRAVIAPANIVICTTPNRISAPVPAPRP